MLCAYCGQPVNQPSGAINRAIDKGAMLYCNRICAGFGRRKNKTKQQKILEKRLYDAEYRKKNVEMLKAKKRSWFKRSYDPVKAAIERKAKMGRHIEYCRSPEYKKYKQSYDRRYRAREYGEFAEAALLLWDIEKEVDTRLSWYERHLLNGTLNKHQQRRREYENLIGCKS